MMIGVYDIILLLGPNPNWVFERDNVDVKIKRQSSKLEFSPEINNWLKRMNISVEIGECYFDPKRFSHNREVLFPSIEDEIKFKLTWM